MIKIRSLRLNIWLPTGMFLALVLFLVAQLITERFQSQQRLTQQAVEQTEINAFNLELAIEHATLTEDLNHAKRLLSMQGLNDQIRLAAVVDSSGLVILSTDYRLVGKPAHEQIPGFDPSLCRSVSKSKIVYPLDGAPEFQHYKALKLPSTDTQSQRGLRAYTSGCLYQDIDLSGSHALQWEKIWTRTLMSTALVTSVMAMLLHFLFTQVSRPTQALKELAKEISHGGAGTSCQIEGNGELAELGHSLNKMSAQIARNVAELRSSQEHNQLLLDNVGEGILTLDLDGKISSINTEALRLLGFPFMALLGNDAHEIIQHSHADDSQYFREHSLILKTLQDGQARSVDDEVFWRSSGEHFPVKYIANPMHKEGDIVGVVVIFTDITEQLKKDEDQRLAATAFETQEAILITNVDSHIVRVNQAFTAITGYSEDDVLGRNPSMLSSSKQSSSFYRAMWQEILTTGHWQGEIWNMRKSGELYAEWLSISAVRNQSGITTHYVGTFTDITDRLETEAKLQQLAYYDPLSGLPNRERFLTQLDVINKGMTRSESTGALFLVDLDGLNQINDALGHDVGDQTILLMTKRLRELAGHEALIGHVSGDNFAIVVAFDDADPSNASFHASTWVSELQVLIKQPAEILGQQVMISCTVGIRTLPQANDSGESLLRQADIALNKSKEGHIGGYRIFIPEMQEQIDQHVTISNNLQSALEKDHLELYYQPQVDGSHNIYSAEALIRWIEPDKGMISPGLFIPIAEESALILDISRWVLRRACEDLSQWQASQLPEHFRHLSVNISPRHFHSQSFESDLQQAVRQADIAPHMLLLELTEGVVIEDIHDTVAKISRLRQQGFHFSIDDFGTGYSSLSYLTSLPIDELKIDQSFVRQMAQHDQAHTIIDTIINMAQSLNMHVIAEGVETEAQEKALHKMGCDRYQGYRFSRPLPKAEFAELVKLGPIAL